MTASPVGSSETTDRTFQGEYPFEPHFLDLNGVRLHYVDEGAGDPLLMVHGNPTWSFAWRKLITDLSQDHRVIAVDHIGCGRSDKPRDYEYTLAQHVANLIQVIDRLELDRITLFAHDWGGAIGMGAATRRPENFRRFVLMNTAAFRSTRIPLRIAACRIPWLGTLGVRGLNLFSRAALSMAVAKPDRMTTAVRDGYLAPYNSWANRIAVDQFVKDIPLRPNSRSYGELVRIENGLSQFMHHPILLPWGMKDWCFSLEFLREFQIRFPKAEAFEIADAGHYLFEDAHEKLLPRIRQFLGDHPL